MKVHDCAQRSEAWYLLRAGKLTGSCAADILSTLKSGKEAAARRDLRARLVAERLTGRPQESGFVSEAMQRGIDKEADAIAAYEVATGRMVTPVGFLEHDALHAGCSPDGLTDADGLIEVKCPKTATHLEYFDAYRANETWYPKDYEAQLVHNLWLSNRKWVDFVSFDDRLPSHLRLIVVRFLRDDSQIASYELAARQFLREVDDAVARYALAPVEEVA